MVSGSGGWGKIPSSTAGYRNSGQTYERKRERLIRIGRHIPKRTGRPMVAGVAVVARSTETYKRTGRPTVAGVARSTETYTRTGRPMVARVAVVARSQAPAVCYVPGKFSLIYFKRLYNTDPLYADNGY